MATFTKVTKTSDVPVNSGKTFSAPGKQIAVFNVEGTLYAIDNICPHKGGPLGEGTLEGTKVTCPWHGWQFEVTTGKFLPAPDRGVASYPVKVEGDDVFVEV